MENSQQKFCNTKNSKFGKRLSFYYPFNRREEW